MSSHASPEAAADDRSPDPAPALTSDFNIPRGAEDPPGPGEPRRGGLRRRLAAVAAGAAVLVGAAYGVSALVPALSGSEPGDGASVVVDDPAPTSEHPGDDVGEPQGASAPPQRVEEPTAAPPAAQVEAPVQEPPPAPSEQEQPADEPAQPAEEPAGSGPSYPPGITEEDVERAWEMWEEYQRQQNGG